MRNRQAPIAFVITSSMEIKTLKIVLEWEESPWGKNVKGSSIIGKLLLA